LSNIVLKLLLLAPIALIAPLAIVAIPSAVLADTGSGENNAHIRRGLKLVDERRVDQAVAEFDQCKNLSSLSDQQILSVLGAYTEAEEESKILPLVNMLIERQSRAKSVASNQERADALFYRGVCYRSLNRTEDAANDYKRAAEFATDKAPHNFDYAGEQYRRIKKYDLAMYCLNRSIALAPSNPIARLHKGQVLTDQQKWTEALPSLSEAISICVQKRKSEPEGYSFVICNAYKERARCYSKVGQLEKAKADRSALGKLGTSWNDTVFGSGPGSAP